MGEENLEQLDELQEQPVEAAPEVEETPEEEAPEESLPEKAVINNENVINSLGLDGPEVDVVEEVSEVEVMVKQGKNKFIVGRELLEV